MSVKVDVLKLYKSICTTIASKGSMEYLNRDESLLFSDMIDKIANGDIILMDEVDYEELETIRLEDEAVQVEIQIAMDRLKQIIKNENEDE